MLLDKATDDCVDSSTPINLNDTATKAVWRSAAMASWDESNVFFSPGRRDGSVATSADGSSKSGAMTRRSDITY